jgi:hypothetical protein
VKDAKSAPLPAEKSHLAPDAQKRRRGEKIGENLRKLYDDVTQEPVPDSFFQLLESADTRKSNPSNPPQGEESGS